MTSLANPPDEFYAHPQAIAEAKALLAHGYGECELPDLGDGDDVMLVSHKDGSVAPARYHRVGDDVDHLGRRSEHVFESWPGSEYSDTIPWSKTLRQTQEGENVPRLGIFRPTKPEHALHGPLLYEARGRKG